MRHCQETKPLTDEECDRLADLFYAKTQPDPDGSECLLWTGGTKSSDEGYGVVHFRGQSWRAHRLAWLLANGSISELVLHNCGNSRCVNPDHLRCGTHSDNLRDAYQHGSRRKPQKLTPQKLRQIQRLKQKGLNSRQIADQLHLPQSTVHDHMQRSGDKYQVPSDKDS